MKDFLQREDRHFPSIVRELLPDIERLYFAGDPSLLQSPSIAAVGSRKCTQYGKTVASGVGRRACEYGVTLVSGLARGIDTAGHSGVLEAGGKTIAVLGGGTEYYYPAENRRLQQQIASEGLLLSFHERTYQPRPFDFPQRNRLIAAISQSIIVVEAGRESGALITAEYGAQYGKNVYAVPGNITSHYSFGTNLLIRDGATALILIDDIFTDMGINKKMVKRTEIELGSQERLILEIIKEGGEVTIEDLHHKTNMKPSEINGIITILEMKGIIFSALGKIFVAKF